MGELDIRNATASSQSSVVKDFTIAAINTDAATGQKESEYINSRWPQQLGYFKSIAELKSAIIMKAVWNVGKGYTADDETKIILDHISGWGKDTFDDILFNMEICRRIGGDSYAEIIKDKETGILINIKPLDPGTMKIIVDEFGIILRYEKTSKNPENKAVIKFKPEEILHLSNNRIADEIHGISDIDAVEKIILGDAESFDDIKKIMHRQAKPMIMFKLGTDDQTTINAFIAKMDAATNKGENIYIPDDKNAVDWEVIQVNIGQILLDWRNELRNKFYRAVTMPQIVFGSAGTTESGGKIEYLAHEQVFEKDQRYLEKQIENQLGLKINLIPPVTLLESLQQDEAKDGAGMQMGMQPSDMMAGAGR